VHSTRSCKW